MSKDNLFFPRGFNPLHLPNKGLKPLGRIASIIYLWLLKHTLFVILFLAAFGKITAQNLPLSTASDSALYYYDKGWEMVMDEGNYSAAEEAYRKAVLFDSDFLVAQSLLGRISGELREREEIAKMLEAKKANLTGDERLLLDVYFELLKLMNVREKEPEKAPAQLEKALALGEKNLNILVHRYPGEIYYKSEFIETIHYRQGPAAALDSLRSLRRDEQKLNPFLLGYEAELEGELGHYELALKKAEVLASLFEGREIPKPNVVFADIYFKMGELEKARQEVDKALSLDPENVDAIRLKKRISEKK